MSATLDAWNQLYAAQTEAIGVALTATVGTVTAAAIASADVLNQILVAGGLSQAGGFNLQMRASDFSNTPPTKLTTAVAALGQSLVVLDCKVNNGIFYIQCGDPTSND